MNSITDVNCNRFIAYMKSPIMSVFNLKSATPFPKCYLHKEKWTFDS